MMTPDLSAERLSYLARHKRLIFPPAPSILHIKAPALPQFRFEWHVSDRRVYLIRLGAVPEIGEPIAFDVPDHASAINIVAVWTRGYREAERAFNPRQAQ